MLPQFSQTFGKKRNVEYVTYAGVKHVEYSRVCSVTNEPYYVTVFEMDAKAWVNGKYIQDAMPYLSAEQREFLISGATPAEWAEMCAEDEED